MPIKYGQYTVPKVDEEVNFKVGQPSPAMLPLDYIRKSAAEKFAEDDPNYLQYGDIPGYKEFRVALAGFLTQEYGAPVDPDELFVTNGVTGGLAMIATLFCHSGDLVLAEDPSYFLALRIFEDFKLTCHQVPIEKDGIDMVALEELLKKEKPKMLYTVPTAQNPTGRTLSEEKRKKLVELAYKYDFLIVADEVYHLLTFPGVHGPLPMPYYDTKKEKVFSVGSFSKILAPALRLGWFQAPKSLLKPIIDCGMFDSSGGINPVMSGVVHKAIDSGLQKKHLDWTRGELHTRCKHLMECCTKYLVPIGCSFEEPLGGYFVLLKLPDGVISTELLDVAVANKVRFLPGTSFGKAYAGYLRLSFSYYNSADIDVGIQRLGEAIKQLQAKK